MLLVLYAFTALGYGLLLACAVKLARRTEINMVHLYLVMTASGGIILTRMNTLLSSLVGQDLLCLVFAYPATVVMQLFEMKGARGFCQVVQSSVWLGWAFAGLFLSVMNLDRLLLYAWTYRYLTRMNNFALVATLAVFALSCG